MQDLHCWYERVCGKKETCSNCKDMSGCLRHSQMYLMTVEANIPGLLPLNHQLEKPKDPTSPDWEAYQRLFSLDMQKFVSEGRSLVIESKNCGNGKTTWAQRLLLKYLIGQLGTSHAGYFLNLPQALFEIKSVISSGEKVPYEDVFSETRLLVLDDVAHKKYTEYEMNWLLRVLSVRQLKGLSTVYTMTTGKEPLSSLIGDRLFSRIYSASECVVFFEKDKRSWEKPLW